ncbi:MAG TPA: alkaline phosphatase family protein [Deltaproteobacteria bacterium]|nr:alkaline phosphatase family protein [Deltaproteobacteria bacterium]HXK47768.1 alkaline phosphatase family protein [Deltaproteobacteria bacterium]
MSKKCILIVLDGLGDRAYEELSGLTPLQAADTPTLDMLAARGSSGLYHAARLGQALPSENAHFFMFGYDPADFPGRGVLEALGAGISVEPSEVAVLAHLVSLRRDADRLVLVRDVPRASPEEAGELIRAVAAYEDHGIRLRFAQTKGVFGVMVLSGEVSPFITDTNTMVEGSLVPALRPWASHAQDPAALRTAGVLKGFFLHARKILGNHPANDLREKRGLDPINGVVTQRPGRIGPVLPMRKRYGFRSLSITSGILFKGISSYLGLDFMEVPDTGSLGEDLAARLRTAMQALREYDFIHVHTKGPDEAAHTKSPRAKKEVIETLDRGLARAIGPALQDPDVLLVVTSDHATPSAGPLVHSGEAVPLTFVGQGIPRDDVQRFDEVSAAAGALGTVRGKELMYLILNHTDRAKLMGIMDMTVDQDYWPGDYEPMTIEDEEGGSHGP